MTYGLTPRMLALLRYVQGYQEAHGISPDYEEMVAGTGVASKSRIGAKLDALEERGHIRRLRNRARAIEVLRPVSIPRDPDLRPLYFVEVAHLPSHQD